MRGFFLADLISGEVWLFNLESINENSYSLASSRFFVLYFVLFISNISLHIRKRVRFLGWNMLSYKLWYSEVIYFYFLHLLAETALFSLILIKLSFCHALPNIASILVLVEGDLLVGFSSSLPLSRLREIIAYFIPENRNLLIIIVIKWSLSIESHQIWDIDDICKTKIRKQQIFTCFHSFYS